MKWREILSRIWTLFRRLKQERGTEAEMRLHLEMEKQAGVRQGLSPAEAERAARVQAGYIAAAMEEVRDQRGLGWLDGSVMDLRQAWIALRRRPGFLLVAVGALASAVAINTVVFTLVYGVLLQPLPYPDPARLARVFEASADHPGFPLSIYNYVEDKRSNRTLEGLALYTRADMQLMHEERAERLTGVAITEGFFPTLGALPVLGRNFSEAEMVRSARVVVVSHSFWMNRLHGDPLIIGKTLRLDRENWTVIGVAPAGFQHVGGDYRSPLQGETVAIWRPLPLDGEAGCARNCHYSNAIARLKPGVPLAAAQQDLNKILEDLAQRFPDSYQGKTARLALLSDEVVGRSRGMILVILTAASLVLLLAGINVAGLSVARALARRRELAIRQALGGNRWRIVRAVLSESVVLGVLSGAVGLAVAAALLPVARVLLPSDFPRLHEVIFRWPAAIFALAAALGTSTLAGLVAAWRQAGTDPNNAVHEEARSASTSLRAVRMRAGLVAAQMALACVLCFAAMLLLRSSMALGTRDPGFNPEGVVTFELSFPSFVYSEDRMAVFYAEAIRRLQEIPGVRSAGFSTSLPWTGYNENSSFGIVGYTPGRNENLEARYQAADAGFFPAIGMRMLEGRLISAADQAVSPKVVVINETLRRRFLSQGGAVGRMLQIWGAPRQVIGVVADIQDQPADRDAIPAFWMPMAQQAFPQVRVAIRAGGDPLALVPAIREKLHSLDAELPMAEVQPMEDIAQAALAERRFTLWVSGAFACLAITLAAIGIYAMLSYSVQQRHREIGIRMALGATRSSVLGSVLASGMVLALAGTGAGLLVAPAVGRGLTSLLYGISPMDTMTLLAAPAMILLVALTGCLAPAWMAIRTEPMGALREQ